MNKDFWSDSDFVDEYCPNCGCILRYDEGDICCWCLERIEKEEPTDDEMKSSFGTKWHDGL